MGSDLTDLGLDPNVKENEGKLPIFPAGDYAMVLVHEVVKETKDKNGKLWVIKHQIISGEHKSGIYTGNINILNKSTICQNIGQGTAKRLCRLVGVPWPPPASETPKMLGKPILVTLGITEDGKYNELVAYNEIDNKPPPVNNQAIPNNTPAQNNTPKPDWP